MANQFLEIPDSFWGLFRSRNRQIYIDALLKINEEYQQLLFKPGDLYPGAERSFCQTESDHGAGRARR